MTNYIQTQVIQPTDSADLNSQEPYTKVIMMVGGEGLYINYNLQQYEGLVDSMIEQRDLLRAAVLKHHGGPNGQSH